MMRKKEGKDVNKAFVNEEGTRVEGRVRGQKKRSQTVSCTLTESL